MQNFLVLGLVPGTNLEITFTSWSCLSVALLLFLSRRTLMSLSHRAHIYLMLCRVAWAIGRGEPDMLSAG